MVYPALLPLMRTPRLPVVDWIDAPANLNGPVRFAETRNLVSARVPSHFNWCLVNYSQYRKLSSMFEMQQTKSYIQLQPYPHSHSIYRIIHPKTFSVEWYLCNCCLIPLKESQRLPLLTHSYLWPFFSWHFLMNTLFMAICPSLVKECVNKPPASWSINECCRKIGSLKRKKLANCTKCELCGPFDMLSMTRLFKKFLTLYEFWIWEQIFILHQEKCKMKGIFTTDRQRSRSYKFNT